MSRPLELRAVAMAIMALFASSMPGVPAWAQSTITRYFPALPSGQPQPPRESGWRISYRVVPNPNPYGGEVLLFDRVEFMKGMLPNGGEDWIRVLNNLALVEMYVPYNNGENVYEDMQMGFELAEMGADALPTYGSIDPQLSVDGKVVVEVVGDGVRYTDHGELNDRFRVRRGQALRIWSTFRAGNYSYVLQYDFADDGRISVRVGGTAQNLISLEDMHAEMNGATHIHMGAWRMEFNLGDPAANTIEVAERERDPATKVGRLVTRPFRGNREGGEVWDPDKFTALMITNTKTMNRHEPPHPVGYMLKTRTMGRMRDNKAYTNFDFWVSRLRPDAASRPAPELKFIQVASKTARPEPTDGRAVVLWHQASLQHIPHGEDFGPVGYRTDQGAAIAHYTGFDLVPMSLWHKTPFLDRVPAPDAERLTATLRRGDQGDAVRRLQQLLNDRGFPVDVDGNYGRGTEAAVRAYQRSIGLPVDGTAGPVTLDRLQG